MVIRKGVSVLLVLVKREHVMIVLREVFAESLPDIGGWG